MNKDFVSIGDFSAQELQSLLDQAIADKALFKQGKLPATLVNKTLAMIFEKPSLRTRVSFEAGMTHLGGHAIYLTRADIGLGSRESVEDIARVLGRMCDGIMARTFSHEFVCDLARHSPVAVINGLTDYSHPCQAMADLMTAQEQFGSLAGRTIAFIGDGNNVARSLAMGCAKLNMKFILAAPKGYELEADCVAKVDSMRVGAYSVTHDPVAAVAGADVIYTDTWVSMGQEDETELRRRHFAGFQINESLLGKAPRHAVVMHCLPAYKGLEITAEAFEMHAETILRQAENRLHFQRTLLSTLMARH